MARKKVEALEEKLEGEVGALKSSMVAMEERVTNMSNHLSNIEAMLKKLIKLYTTQPHADTHMVNEPTTTEFSSTQRALKEGKEGQTIRVEQEIHKEVMASPVFEVMTAHHGALWYGGLIIPLGSVFVDEIFSE